MARGRGRPPLELNEKAIEALASVGATNTEIASKLGIDYDTLIPKYSDVIEKGREQGRTSLRGKQFEVAMNGNVTMLIWLGKQMLGQRDKIDVDANHKSGGGLAAFSRVEVVAPEPAPAEEPVRDENPLPVLD